MNTDENRSTALKIMPALAIAAPSGAHAKTTAIGDRDLAAVILELFAQPDTAQLLGSAFLKERPHEASFSRLMTTLRADLDLVGWCRAGADKFDLHRRLQARAALDFDQDEGIEVAGCYLSVTELRVYALSTFS